MRGRSHLFRAALLASVAVAHLAVAADPPTKAQRRCLLALDAAGAHVGRTAIADGLRCVRSAVRGRLTGPAIADCLAAPSAALGRVQAKTVRIAQKKCSETPTFGPNNAAEVNAAYAAPLRVTALFGDVATTLRTAAADRPTASCQLALAQELATLARARIDAYVTCARQRVKQGRALEAADLEVCVGGASPALTRAVGRASKRVGARCADVSPADACPGDCATTPLSGLAACLDGVAACGACLAANGADHLAKGCHVFADGVAVEYCGTRPSTTQSIARQWDEETLSAIRRDNPRPPVHARNLFHVSVAMYDAWAVYDTVAKPYRVHERVTSSNVPRDREVAISFAAYRVLSSRYSSDVAIGADVSQASFDARMLALGLDKTFTSTTGNGPAAVGNRIGAAVLAAGASDGANEANNYGDPTYTPVNQPLIVKVPDIDLTLSSVPGYMLDPNRWQPLALDQMIGQNGVPLPGKIQKFVGSQWGDVTPFALTRSDPSELWLDPGPQPRLDTDEPTVKAQLLEVLRKDSWLSPDDPTTMDIGLDVFGNNPLASNAGTGYAENPVTHQPYASQVVKRGDFGRVIAEYWADGPTSETPPGHWNVLANQVADSAGFERRIGGTGPALDALEWDVKMYLALNGAVHDAAIACWGAKRKYDGVRPITETRYLSKVGQLPLEDGVAEVITSQTAAPGGKHAHLIGGTAGGQVGDIAVLAWPGSPTDPKTQHSGTVWILGRGWSPYQRSTFVTPAFPGYYSGHSTFSRSAAEVLTILTGSEYFPGGLGEFVVPQNGFLQFEQGPSTEVRLQWARYYDAADQAGQSRLWGGIHVEADDFTGRTRGHQIGIDAANKALTYFDGSAP